MSHIRRQSLISSAIVYFGFALGFLNTYLFTREGSGFSSAEYGLINLFIALANIMLAFANLGMNTYIGKFHPYYKDHLKAKQNDQLTIALSISTIGFLLVAGSGWIFKDLVIRKFGTNSPQLITYYRWLFPFGMGLTLYSILETYGWVLHHSVITNYLREVQFRLFITVMILLFSAGVIYDFDLFIKLYAFTYLLLAGVLVIFLITRKQFHLTLTLSRVTRKFRKKMITFVSFIWGGSLLFSISQFFDSLVIAAVLKNGLALTGVYSLAQNISSLIQAPQRGILSASVGPLSQAWKDKNLDKIKTIYHRSSINQIVFSIGMFALLWLNFEDGVATFHLQSGYLDAKIIFLFIGLMRIIDMGTGLNGQIIATSSYWRVDFFTGIFLIAITLPLNYLMTRSLGVVGPAISNLISLSLYNLIRFFFLWKKFNLQPFDLKSALPIPLGLTGYLVCHYLFGDHQGLQWMLLRSSVFIGIYLSGVLFFDISPDIKPVWQTLLKKMGLSSENRNVA